MGHSGCNVIKDSFGVVFFFFFLSWLMCLQSMQHSSCMRQGVITVRSIMCLREGEYTGDYSVRPLQVKNRERLLGCTFSEL